MEVTLQDLATRFGLELRGKPDIRIVGVCGLAPGQPGCISFLSDPRLDKQLATTQASAVVLKQDMAGLARVPVLISANPQLDFARLAALWDARVRPQAGIHPSASVHASAQVDASASIGACAVVQAGACIGARVEVGPGCVIGHEVAIGEDSRLVANVSVGDRVSIGCRVTIEPGVVIGGRGFGLVRDGERWIEMPQLGTVRIADDVEVGANSTIDRGAIDDTVIEQGVKIDSQVQIAHNCRIGANTVIAGCSAIAGSVIIGQNCVLAGAVGIVDHVRLADNVIVTARSLVTRNLDTAGMYSSGWGARPAADWRRQVASLRRLATKTGPRKSGQDKD
jgi:UDP-3-O-[3-hydroxymyristoyl] glucosamine N-acyltransferase